VVVDANRDGVLDTYQDVPHAEWTEFWGSEDRYR
jgi:hypothetical protein